MLHGETIIVESFELKVPRIVEDELWNSVQEKMDREYPLQFDGKSKKSLLKGLLICPTCKLRLGHRFKTNNHYFGKCSEVNWKKVGEKIDLKTCPIKKSPRMEELDEKVFDVVLKVIKDSKKIREDYKSKNLQPRFEEKEKIRTQRETLQRKIRTKKSKTKNIIVCFFKLSFSLSELLGGVVGVIIFSLLVRPTPVLGACGVFLFCQVTVRWLQTTRISKG